MARTVFDIAKAVANLLDYSTSKLGLTTVDKMYAQNQLFDWLEINEPTQGNYTSAMELHKSILEPIAKYAIRNGFTKFEELTETNLQTVEAKVMGFVTPSAGLVVNTFQSKAAYLGIQQATDYLYDLSKDSYYIRTKDIEKNMVWNASSERGNIVVTINLSKPEKDNKQVAYERTLPQQSYPKCVICPDVIGYAGSHKVPARQPLRMIPLNLANENWFLQYSPYVYFDNHCIAISEKHEPMEISRNTFVRLADFVEQFPHYFMGSNADLPIVGGSILSHNHFQGGKKVLPMFERGIRKRFSSATYKNAEIGILDWYNSVVSIRSKDRAQAIRCASSVLSAWREYTDKEHNIIAKTEDEPHNTITSVATYTEDEGYTFYLILRNNRTTSKYPHGIFHPTADMHNIKGEGIGIIEAMGTFILPGRLFNEMQCIAEVLTGAKPADFRKMSTSEKHPLHKHLGMVMQLVNDHGTALEEEQAESIITEYINNTCFKILDCTAVFKNTEEGQAGFAKFLAKAGIN
ncbi:MAG: UDP-glucose--hexose-1-phosphate uridylyltransferase [Bacillota bacterium]